MAYRALWSIAAALLITACDVSQKLPQTDSLPTTTAIVKPPGASADAAGEKSIRLFGPGVSRKRQTRV